MSVAPEVTGEPNVSEAIIAAEQRISADSHMAEPLDLWQQRLPQHLRDRALRFPRLKLFETDHHLRAGGWDPAERLKDLALDGVSAEVLYPTLGKQAWLTGDPGLEEACIRVYNDWLIEFCDVAPERFWGLAMISFWNMDRAVRELERCQNAGLRGATIWLIPPEQLPLSSDYYEPFWEAAESLNMPVSLHINTGLWRNAGQQAREGLLPQSVHKFDCMKALAEIVASGATARHPRLRLVVAEAGVGWIPFFTQELDYHLRRADLPKAPSEYVFGQVYATFISDRVGGLLLSHYGKNNFMWSNDYPHPTSTWPGSTRVIAQDLGHLSTEDRARVVCGNVARLYNGGRLPPLADPAGELTDLEAWNKEHHSRTSRERPSWAEQEGQASWSKERRG